MVFLLALSLSHLYASDEIPVRWQILSPLHLPWDHAVTWLRRNKDWLITLAVFLFFAFILLLYNVLFKNQSREKIPVETQKPTFELPADQSSAADGQPGEKTLETTSFFLSPSPSELFEKLENLSQLEFKQQTKDLPGLKVMWPAYFFSVRGVEDRQAEILLDASENGFGVTLVTTVDTTRYPEILTLERGKKIWLAAEITGVDPQGTGQFYLDTDYMRFDDYQPPVSPEPAAQTE